MPRSKFILSLLASVAFGLCAASPAKADLVILGSTDNLGSGIGSQLTILNFTVTGPPSNTTEEAAIIRNMLGVDQVFAGANTQVTGGSNNQTRTLGEAGITNGSEFRLVLNINETGPESANDISLVDLSARFYLSNGTLLHIANLTDCGPFSTGGGTGSAPPCILPEVGSGIGGQGIVFGLNAAQALTISGLITTHGAGNIYVGIGGQDAMSLVTIADADGGFETFNLARGPGAAPIPEPASMLLLGTGLAGLASGIRRRRRNKR